MTPSPRFIHRRHPSEPRTIRSLNGAWSLSPGGADRAPDSFPYLIDVPSVVDCTRPSLKEADADFYWYRCTLVTEELHNDEIAILRIDQAQFGTVVWVDGHEAGHSIACYTSQEYDITRLIRPAGEHVVDIRVGQKRTLPPEHSAGRDFEKTTYTPGIWGDVSLIVSGTPRIENIQVIPYIGSENAEVRVTLDRCPEQASRINVIVRIVEAASGTEAGRASVTVQDPQKGIVTVGLNVPVPHCHLWSPDDPFLYLAIVAVERDGHSIDRTSVRFGMREFVVRGNQFLLNGLPITLKGSNIAFHRFLADPERERLPWDPSWVKKLLIDIPKHHNFNFFRFHLGHAYNAWYDLADEHGMLLQDEWHFWGATGANGQVEYEFRQWLRDNWNHPSIVIWDPLNESTDDSLIHDIVPAMKTLDPTRPWESADFKEQHPYIYSLGMTLPDRAFGFTDSLATLQSSTRPVMVNEFLWWWTDAEGRATSLMKGVTERWLGKTYTPEDVRSRQEYLAHELVGLFRRSGFAAIQPFVYLSNSDGPTGNWFEGPIRELKPKPLLRALANAFAPFGVSMELWDRHFVAGTTVSFPVHVFNDLRTHTTGTLAVQIFDSNDEERYTTHHQISLSSGERIVLTANVVVPANEGPFVVRGTLVREDGSVSATTERRAYAFGLRPSSKSDRRTLLLDPTKEISAYLKDRGMPFVAFQEGDLSSATLVFVNTFGLEQTVYRSRLRDIGAFVDRGGTLVIQEPEFRLTDSKVFTVLPDLTLAIERRRDIDRGGYDSYVFPEDMSHPLWNGLRREHLQWFNGAFGGEIVSEYVLTPSADADTLASCGLDLTIRAVMEIRRGKGKVVISRIQVRGRLFAGPSVLDRPFARRYDPVAARYLENLLSL